jgi:hypothetical protein
MQFEPEAGSPCCRKEMHGVIQFENAAFAENITEPCKIFLLNPWQYLGNHEIDVAQGIALVLRWNGVRPHVGCHDIHRLSGVENSHGFQLSEFGLEVQSVA